MLVSVVNLREPKSIASPVCWVVRKAPTTAFYFIQSAMTGFIASAFLSRNRVSLKEAFEGHELCEGKLSCTVLRGLDGSNPVRLLDNPPETRSDMLLISRGIGFRLSLQPNGVELRLHWLTKCARGRLGRGRASLRAEHRMPRTMHRDCAVYLSGTRWGSARRSSLDAEGQLHSTLMPSSVQS
jgi:hypothetical protein